MRTLNWIATGIAATFAAYFGFEHLQRVFLSMFQMHALYFWTGYILAIASPICIAAAWLRLTGVTWRQALRLFLIVPAGVFVLWYATHVLVYQFAS